MLLLVYIALEGEQSRDHLRELFFPNSNDSAGNLRTTINRVRKIYPEAFEGSKLRLRTAIRCDASEVLYALEHQDLAQTVTTYTAPFLEHLEVSEVHPELLEWIQTMRAYLARGVAEARVILAERALENSEVVKAREHLEAARYIPGLQQLELSLVQRLAALEAQLESNLEMPKPKAIPNNLAQSMTTFIGRNRESQHILELIQEDARLVTLVGPGGVGKTRLALETARQTLQLEIFADGVFMVMLEAITDLETLLSRIVLVLKLSPKPDAPMLEQIIGGIAERRILLVLDNFEHLLEHATHLTRLLEHCPNLRIIVTSRERLNLHSEWVTLLEGLSLISEQQTALELFLDRTARIGIHIRLEEREDALEICKLIHGFPLAIELAVPLLRALSLNELRADLSRNLDLLDSTLRDTPERHRSIRAVFEHSWKMLTPPQQYALAQLAVFRGGTTREAIGAITATKLQTLASLTDKTLVQRDENTRFGIHPLLYQFTLEKLLELPDFETRFARHSDYYLSKLEQDTAQIRGSNAANAMNNIETELENIRAAWSYAIQHKQAARLEKVQDVVVFFDQNSRFTEGLMWFEEAIQALEVDPTQSLALAAMLIGGAWLQFRLGQNQEARERAERARKLARALEEIGEVILSKALNILGVIATTMVEYDSAIQFYEGALILIRKYNDESREVTCLSNLAMLESMIGNINKVVKYYNKLVLKLEKRKEYSALILSKLTFSGILLSNHPNPNFDDIRKSLETGLDLIYSTNLQKMTIPYYLLNLSLCLYELENYVKSEYYAKLTLENLSNQSSEEIKSGAYLVLGRIEIQNKNLESAEKYILVSLKILQDISDNSQRVDGLISLALLRGLLNQKNDSKRIIRLILGQNFLQVAQKREIQSTIKLLNLSIPESLLQSSRMKESIQDFVNELLMTKGN